MNCYCDIILFSLFFIIGNEIGSVFVYFCITMRKISAAVFSILILLSSGLVQFVVHVCPKDGLMLSEAGCSMHEIKPSSCCDEGKPTSVKTIDDECCSDDYLFIVSPKYGSIQHLQSVEPFFFYLTESTKLLPNQDCPFEATWGIASHSPPWNNGRQILNDICTLTI